MLSQQELNRRIACITTFEDEFIQHEFPQLMYSEKTIAGLKRFTLSESLDRFDFGVIRYFLKNDYDKFLNGKTCLLDWKQMTIESFRPQQVIPEVEQKPRTDNPARDGRNVVTVDTAYLQKARFEKEKRIQANSRAAREEAARPAPTLSANPTKKEIRDWMMHDKVTRDAIRYERSKPGRAAQLDAILAGN